MKWIAHDWGRYLIVSNILIQAIIKTKNQLIDFSDSSWQYFPDTGRTTGA